jgi:hypothetical protein
MKIADGQTDRSTVYALRITNTFISGSLSLTRRGPEPERKFGVTLRFHFELEN